LATDLGTNERALLLRERDSSPSDCHLLAALKEYLSGHHFEDDRKVHSWDKMAVNKGQGLISTGNRKACHTIRKNGSVMAGTTWKCSLRAQQLNVDCSY